ncbi:hypothetical protein BsWGS_11453 [Bradybaena similaris]
MVEIDLTDDKGKVQGIEKYYTNTIPAQDKEMNTVWSQHADVDDDEIGKPDLSTLSAVRVFACHQNKFVEKQKIASVSHVVLEDPHNIKNSRGCVSCLERLPLEFHSA